MGNCRNGKTVQDAGMDRAWPGYHQQLFFVHIHSTAKNFFSFLSIILNKSSKFDAKNLTGEADLLSMSRPLIRDPYLVKKFRKDKIKKSECISCNKCFNPRGVCCAELKKKP
jgi:2,4-dienoyl-CoA reductase-like NADH-dependent reductase (Old Yellow Enzyme family)